MLSVFGTGIGLDTGNLPHFLGRVRLATLSQESLGLVLDKGQVRPGIHRRGTRPGPRPPPFIRLLSAGHQGLQLCDPTLKRCYDFTDLCFRVSRRDVLWAVDVPSDYLKDNGLFGPAVVTGFC